MTAVILTFKPRPKPPKSNLNKQDATAIVCVDFLRTKLYELPSTESRVKLIMVLISQLIVWTRASQFYANPRAILLTWVENQFNKTGVRENEGGR